MNKWYLVDSDLNVLPFDAKSVNLDEFFKGEQVDFKIDNIIRANKKGNITEFKSKIGKIIKGE